MVAVDRSTGLSYGVSGAALAGGPLLIIPGRRLQDIAHVAGSANPGGFPAYFNRQRTVVSAPDTQAAALAQRDDLLPSQWGIPSYFGGAAYGPPYELANRISEWSLSAEATFAFAPVDRQARIAQRVHPRGPALHTGGAFLAALYGTSPTPPHLGIGVDSSS
ncbi:MAG TPA: hypothetical protein VNM48_06855 [Chloroflexota bacterium]|nr:hypothetical protein [Chloroflexota bacterium]